ncbi:MAG: GIY-YIG nuclease family protein [Bacteroidota bacterium]
MFHTYILYSEDIDRYYIGYCGHDLESRLRAHLSNHKGFTAKAKDWKVAHVETFTSKKEAMDRERQIKKWKSRKMVEALISGD